MQDESKRNHLDRRDLVKATVLGAGAFALSSREASARAQAAVQAKATMYALPALPYKDDALAPVISANR